MDLDGWLYRKRGGEREKRERERPKSGKRPGDALITPLPYTLRALELPEHYEVKVAVECNVVGARSTCSRIASADKVPQNCSGLGTLQSSIR